MWVLRITYCLWIGCIRSELGPIMPANSFYGINVVGIDIFLYYLLLLFSSCPVTFFHLLLSSIWILS